MTKKKKLRRSSLSEARVWHKMDGDPCLCPTSLEDLSTEERMQHTGEARYDQLSRWAVALAKCYREISAAALIRGVLDTRTFLGTISRAGEWDSRASLGANGTSESDLRLLVEHICGEVRHHADSCGITNRMDLHPEVPGWETRMWLAANHGQYTVPMAADRLHCGDHDIHRYLESIGLGPTQMKGKRL